MYHVDGTSLITRAGSQIWITELFVGVGGIIWFDSTLVEPTKIAKPNGPCAAKSEFDH